MKRLAIGVALLAGLGGRAWADMAPPPDPAPVTGEGGVTISGSATITAEPVTTTTTTTEPAEAPDDDEDGGTPVTRGTEKGTIGVGLMLGEPTGVTARLYLADDQAIQASAGVAFFGSGFQVTADYVIHPYILSIKPEYVLATYVGPGVRVIDYNRHDDTYLGLGLRAVGGLLIDFQIPLDAFVEVAGVVEYRFQDGEGFGIAINAAAGARYYF